MIPVEIPGQLNEAEREIISASILEAETKPKIVLEVGTWLGGGSTLCFLRALERNGEGHLWGIEADPSIYARMLANIQSAAPNALHLFTPLFGLSWEIIPDWLKQLGPNANVDVVFLDGGDNPIEQVLEFTLLADRIPIGGQLFAHDAKLRKGKWLRPYLSSLDNWEVTFHDISAEGLLSARKLRASPSSKSLRSAKRQLMWMRLKPVELIGRSLPTPVCDVILKLLPERLRNRVSQGR